MNATVQNFVRRLIVVVLFVGAIGVVPRVALAGQAAPARAEQATHEAGEANLVVPDLSTVTFRGWNGRTLLLGGLGVCALGATCAPDCGETIAGGDGIWSKMLEVVPPTA